MMEENTLQHESNEILSSILDILDTAISGGIELLGQLYQNMQQSDVIVDDLLEVVRAVNKAQPPILADRTYAYITQMADNLNDTLRKIKDFLQKKEWEKARNLTEFQILPFFRIWKEAFYFWGFIYPDAEKMQLYYQQEFASHYCSPYWQDENESEYTVSIVIPAYNHLDTTKQCIEHILKYTDFEKLNAELILIDHGSNDGTLEYFQSIPNAKVIHFKNNIRMYMFAMIPLVCQGKYLALINNDILVTKNWLENLLSCMASDEKIALAVPMTPNVCNLQMISVPTNDPKEFVSWANEFNHCNPNLRSDRVRLMPSLGIYCMKILCEVGLVDPYFYSMEFWDDDFSLRVRRAGYRQVLCEDTACYHFGSVTSKEAQKEESTLQYGRKLFEKKNNVDAWGTGFCYDYTAIQIFKQISLQNNNLDILGLDCGFGDTLLQMRNELRHLNKSCKLYNLTIQMEYEPDLKPLSDEFEFSCSLMSEALSQAFTNKQFDIIYLSQDIAEYSDYKQILIVAKQRLKSNGIFLLWSKNPWHVLTLHQMLQFTLPEKRMTFLEPSELEDTAQEVFSRVQILPVKQDISGIDGFVKQHYLGYNKIRNQVVEKISTQSNYLVCMI